jgi:hypothetical protein
MSALTVVYLKTTGHVLAALTRAAPPEGAEQVNAFVGANLPVRGIGTTPADFAFPANLLDAVTLDDSLPLAVIDPQAFQVVQDPQDKTHPKVTQFLGTASAPATTLSLDATSGATVTVKNVPPTTSLQAVVILQKVTAPAQAATIYPPVTVTGDPNGTVVDSKAGFAAGETWNFYALVQGTPPSSLSKTL